MCTRENQLFLQIEEDFPCFWPVLLAQGGGDLLVYCLKQRSIVALNCLPGLQASPQDVFEVVVNVNFVGPHQVLPNPWVQDVATVGDVKVSEMNSTRERGGLCWGRLT